MTMYKPGTQLIIIDVWAAIVARELRFEIDSGRVHWDKKTEFWNTGFSVSADKWRITVTKSGPNAAERFLPQVGDLIESSAGSHFIVDEPARSGDPVWVGNRYQRGTHSPFVECRRIIERNGTPFPQFSEVIEP